MEMRRIPALAVCLAFTGCLAGGNSAQAGIPKETTIVCPIDGKAFTFTDTISLTTFGYRLDAKMVTSADWVDWPPICPENGFPVYQDNFSEEELGAIRKVVDSEEYALARDGNVPSYMMYFVRKRLGVDDYNLAWDLLQAIWDAELESPEPYHRYMELAIEHLEVFLAASAAHDDDWWTAQFLIANFDRKLGRFDDAVTRLEGLPTDSLAKDSIFLKFIDRIAHFARLGDFEPHYLRAR